MSFESEIGAVCFVCGLRDFLPFQCAYCHNVFCLEHRTLDGHGCVEATAATTSMTPAQPPRASFRCSLAGCSTSQLVPVVCERCRENFCFAHRHYADHVCVEAAVPAAFSRPKHTPLDLKVLGAASSTSAAAAAASGGGVHAPPKVMGSSTRNSALERHVISILRLACSFLKKR